MDFVAVLASRRPMWLIPGLHRCFEVDPVQEAGHMMATVARPLEAENMGCSVEGVGKW